MIKIMSGVRSGKLKRNKIVCDECKHGFYLNAVKIDEILVELQGVNVNLVYFTCPKCKKIYRISIQDKRYYELVEDLEKTKRKIQNNFGNKDIEKARNLRQMVEIKKKRLADYVQLVNSKFTGTFVFDTSENGKKNKNIKYLP